MFIYGISIRVFFVVAETAMGTTLDTNNETQKNYLKSIYE